MCESCGCAGRRIPSRPLRDPVKTRASIRIPVVSVPLERMSPERDETVDGIGSVHRVEEVKEIVQAYEEAGVNELIIPDFTLGDRDRKIATLDTFITQVAGR